MKQQSVKKNIVLQGVYQFFMLGIGFVISPYLTRVLGAEKLGIYTYVNSIAYYFVIFANLGISRYGQRIIASSSTSPSKLGKAFYSLLGMHAMISALSLIMYFSFVKNFVTEEKTLFYIEALYVVSAFFDITWFFYGVEDFRNVVIKNTIIKLIEFGCIFVFIHDRSDIEMYTFIMAGSSVLGQTIMMPQAAKKVRLVPIGLNDCFSHLKSLLLLSISVVAVTLYTVFDKTLLGLMLDMESVSYYECAHRIIGVPQIILGTIPTVLFPRSCRLVEEKKEADLHHLFKSTFFLTAVIGIGFTACIIAIAENFASLYFGAGFEKTGKVIIAMAPVILVIALGDVIRTQLMISQKRDGSYIFCVIINAIVNLFLSVFLIPLVGIYGAVIGSVAAEVCGLALESCFCKQHIDFKQTYGQILPFVILGIIAVALTKMGLRTEACSFLVTLLQGAMAASIYVVLSSVYFVCFKKGAITKMIRMLRR